MGTNTEFEKRGALCLLEMVQDLKKIWAFGIPYLKPYGFRFVLGIALSIFFGVSNDLLVLSINTLFSCLASKITPSDRTAIPSEVYFLGV